jgi:hypothetical protein
VSQIVRSTLSEDVVVVVEEEEEAAAAAASRDVFIMRNFTV